MMAPQLPYEPNYFFFELVFIIIKLKIKKKLRKKNKKKLLFCVEN